MEISTVELTDSQDDIPVHPPIRREITDKEEIHRLFGFISVFPAPFSKGLGSFAFVECLDKQNKRLALLFFNLVCKDVTFTSEERWPKILKKRGLAYFNQLIDENINKKIR
jgi:hypothetical protein